LEQIGERVSHLSDSGTLLEEQDNKTAKNVSNNELDPAFNIGSKLGILKTLKMAEQTFEDVGCFFPILARHVTATKLSEQMLEALRSEYFRYELINFSNDLNEFVTYFHEGQWPAFALKVGDFFQINPSRQDIQKGKVGPIGRVEHFFRHEVYKNGHAVIYYWIKMRPYFKVGAQSNPKRHPLTNNLLLSFNRFKPSEYYPHYTVRSPENVVPVDLEFFLTKKPNGKNTEYEPPLRRLSYQDWEHNTDYTKGFLLEAS